MWHSPFPSNTSRFVLALACALAAGCAGCGDDECGPMGAEPSALLASSADVALTYGGLTALAGNDCPGVDPPAGVVSLSVEGRQTDGTGLITFCIPRPDVFNGVRAPLGTSLSMADVRIFDLTGSDANGCTYALDSTRPPTGFASGLGLCNNGTDSAGFGVDFDGAVSLRRTCGSTIDSVAVTLTGLVSVAKR
jgi:hypothetical protein